MPELDENCVEIGTKRITIGIDMNGRKRPMQCRLVRPSQEYLDAYSETEHIPWMIRVQYSQQEDDEGYFYDCPIEEGFTLGLGEVDFECEEFGRPDLDALFRERYEVNTRAFELMKADMGGQK